MCGIAGIIDFRGRPIDEGLLHRFNACLAHRGPDDRGVFVHARDGFSAGLAHTRLAVIDPTPEGHQPMLDASGRYAVTYNGELYNYRTLREQLPVPCRTQSDTEVVLQSLIVWGPEALPRLDGMWALAFLDLDRWAGHLSRDPLGIKPLYYAFHDDRLVFASELNAIRMIPGMPLDLDPDALDIYLHLGFIPHPYTIYRHIRKLPPGRVLRFDAQGVREPEPYGMADRRWPMAEGSGQDQSPVSGRSEISSYAQALREVRRLTMEAVQRQRVSDVPLGAFLSGGLDSSIVVACLAQAGGPAVKTFSIGYAEHGRYDETRYACLVAKHLQTEHHEFRLTFRDVLDTIEPVLGHLGEPFADSSLLPTTLVSRHTRGHVTVALSGDGGDELFGGYWRYLAHGYLDRYLRLPGIVRRGMIEPFLRLAPAARSNRVLDRLRQARKLLRGANAPDAIGRHLAWARWIEPAAAADLLGRKRANRAASTIESMYRAAAAGAPGLARTQDSLDAVMSADRAVSLPADMLFKVDTASMMHALEVRVPLLSVDLVQYVAALPLEYKIHQGVGKRVLRDAFRDLLPPEILSRRKMGFEVPIGEFLRHELRDLYGGLVTRDALASLGLESVAAARLYDEHLTRREDHADLLWSLLVLCSWHGKSRQAQPMPP